MKKIAPEYTFSEQQLKDIKNLAAECRLLEDTVKILYGRGVDTAEKIEAFIHPSSEHFISPFKMSGMDKAVELITRARDEEWSVVVYGDYDADGICAATIMRNILRDFGVEPYVFVPERRDGYGLCIPAIDAIFEEYFPQLFITVDCGISCAEQIEYIKEQGAEVIVTDHHELPENLPDCICINPKFDDGYIYDNLCGAGVALKVGYALLGEQAAKYLDFAAIATVADSVPLTGENRDIVCEGLKLINSNPRKCYLHFLKAENEVNSHTLAFTLAPRINAAGRMGDAHAALELFDCTEENLVFALSAKLSEFNIERQKYCDGLYLSAKAKLREKGAFGRIIMLWDEEWNSGFVGIVAARLSEEFSRPAILFVKNGDTLKGSARSVESVNIFDALRACSDLLGEYGGHAQAAGVNVSVENFEKLYTALNSYLTEKYTAEDFEPTLYINGKLDRACSPRLAKELELLEPYGVGNRMPMFEVEECAVDMRPLKFGSPHLTGRGQKIDLMYFGGAKHIRLLQSRAPKRCVFEYNVSKYRGREFVKGFIRDLIVPAEAAAFADIEIDVNNILTLACPQINCNINYKTCAEIDAELANLGDYGTVVIASGYSTLIRYKNAKKLPAELFGLLSGDLSNVVLISPLATVDLSGFNRAIFLEKPHSGVRIKSLEGKEVIICSDISGDNFIENLPSQRGDLLKIFAAVAANAANITGSDSWEVSLYNNLGVSPQSLAYALEVFRQLNLISFEEGKLSVFRGVKSELKNSELYRIVAKI